MPERAAESLRLLEVFKWALPVAPATTNLIRWFCMKFKPALTFGTKAAQAQIVLPRPENQISIRIARNHLGVLIS